MDPRSHGAARPLLPHTQAMRLPSEGDPHIPIQSLVQSNVLDLGEGSMGRILLHSLA